MVRPGTLILLAWTSVGVSCSYVGKTKPQQSDTVGDTRHELLSPAALEALRTSEHPPFIVDVRPLASYQQGHIPGAVQVWRDAFTRTDLPFEGMAITRPGMQDLLDSLGLRPDQLVVAYDDRASCEAARFWWIMQVFGHPNVVILDGGIGHWRAKGLPIDHGWVATNRSAYSFPKPADSTMVATISDVKHMIASGGGVILDTRSTEEYNGTEVPEGSVVASHIPTSIHYDWGNTVDMNADQCIRHTTELTQQIAALGIHPTDTVITYCRSGVRSAHTTFVLTQVLGMHHVRNYDGSWAEWSHTLEHSADTISSKNTLQH